MKSIWILALLAITPGFAHADSRLTLALHYVSYSSPNGEPIVSAETAAKVVRETNQIFSVCNIHFELEEFKMVQAPFLLSAGLSFSPSKMDDLTQIRQAFEHPGRVLIVTTGKWNHKGGLGADGANAWTTLPGASPSGAVVEASAGNYAALIAHELGHYLNLDHAKDVANLMHPVVYETSRTIKPWQCRSLRKTALTRRTETLRAEGSVFSNVNKS